MMLFWFEFKKWEIVVSCLPTVDQYWWVRWVDMAWTQIARQMYLLFIWFNHKSRKSIYMKLYRTLHLEAFQYSCEQKCKWSVSTEGEGGIKGEINSPPATDGSLSHTHTHTNKHNFSHICHCSPLCFTSRRNFPNNSHSSRQSCVQFFSF